ncbi:hypothetical protein M8818_000970 [Zalaria obscura]|uniref:Uncharacterized protein n=1 Tax=Zalaria obscura TaxID=2024903 RepID=A0ACC3SM57_9PEZI
MVHLSRCFNATTKSLLSSYARVGAPAIDQSSRVTRAVHLRRHHDVRLKETRCVITGASRGIGKAIAVALARSHASCLLIGRDETALNATLSDCNAASSETSSTAVSHSVNTGDVSSYDFWQSLKLPGDRVDILINAAGITHSSLFLRESPGSMERIVQTNLMGTMWATMTPQAREEALSKIPLKRFGSAEEIAEAAIFLAANSYANNCVINLDGGLSATVSALEYSRLDAC